MKRKYNGGRYAQFIPKFRRGDALIIAEQLKMKVGTVQAIISGKRNQETESGDRIFIAFRELFESRAKCY